MNGSRGLGASVLLAFALAFAPPALARKCGAAIHPKHQERRVIQFVDDISGPSFYARFDRFVMYVSPDVVLSRLEKTTGSSNKALTEALRKEMPLKQDFDLFDLAVNRTTGMIEIKEFLADAIDMGRGRFRDMYRDTRPRTVEDNQIVRVSVELGKSPMAAREYCNRSGELLFFVIDGIEN